MRVVINAQIDPEQAGGIAQVLVGLAHALSQLETEDEFVFVCRPASAAWLRKFIEEPVRLVVNFGSTPAPPRGIRPSDGFFESFEPDVLHFPYQAYTRTAIPSVFNPHDLQHVHLPTLFDPEEIERREVLYRAACEAAAAIAVASNFVREDVATHYALPQERLHVIPWGAPTAAYPKPSVEEIERTLARFHLERGFTIYPAQTWPHKNHLRLLEAMSRLRDRTLAGTQLVCTGAQTDHYEEIRARIEQLDLADAVRFTGRVSETELVALYRSACCMIVPTLFEAASFPVYEAWAMELPVACSTVTSLPEQVGDAGLLFDPESVEDIAAKWQTLLTDDTLTAQLRERGRRRLGDFNWEQTARAYQELYHAVARQATHTLPETQTLQETST